MSRAVIIGLIAVSGLSACATTSNDGTLAECEISKGNNRTYPGYTFNEK